MNHRSSNLFALSLFALFFGTQAIGQVVVPREDDHFQRELVVHRIDLSEKLNQAMVTPTDPALYSDAMNGGQQGLVQALFDGLQQGRYLAYDPDNVQESLTLEDVAARCMRMTNTETEGTEWLDDASDEDCDWCGEEEDLIVDESLAGERSGEYLEDQASSSVAAGDFDKVDLSAMESVVEFVEHRIFDKNRSQQIHDIQYIRIVWVDPAETLPDQNVICIRFSDAREVLEGCAWNNRFNEAEHRNLLEVFDQRIFHSFPTVVSGRGIRTLEESAFRRNAMLAFEQQLWSY